ncbi:WD40 repeat domain-containing protein [Saccharothrix xinjiangensis]|uniref:AAA+ ATPase domain-containing protein n=1 Tax=Saccharothrix xinjiangensis TaxID=204798 RepID=A0ABV9Y645_9PSEU
MPGAPVTALPDEGARILVVASSTDPSDVVGRTVRDLRTVLVERCGVPPERLRVAPDPADARTAAEVVVEEAGRAGSALLVYVAGRCLVSSAGEWYLVVDGVAGPGLLSLSVLRQALRTGRARSVAVVLDCFTEDDAAPPRTDGMYVIASSGAGVPDEADGHTALGGALIDLLVRGDPLGPRLLTLDAVHDALSRALPEAARPLPLPAAGDPAGALVVAPNPAARAGGPCPGLLPFGEEDTGRFHGRERVVDRLVEAVARPGPLVLVGPAGSGKTSLLLAGLLGRLRRGGVPGVPADLRCRVVTPGPEPLERLVGGAPGAADVLRRDPHRAEEVLGGRSVVVVDQAEELFALCRDPAERAAFVRVLSALAERGSAGTPVVLALRADFCGHAAAHPELVAALRDNQVLVEPMTRDERRAAIEGATAGLELEDGLVDLILADSDAVGGASPAPLSLAPLSHALWTTWLRRAGTRLTVAGYRDGGGVEHGVARWAEHVHSRLDPAGQEAVRRVLPRLVVLGEGAADTAATLDLEALTHGLPDVPAARRAVARLAEARLLVLRDGAVRISHGLLSGAWPRLAEWLDAERDWRRARARFAADAARWERSGRARSLLYRGERLAEATRLAVASPGRAADLDSGTTGFLDSSWRRDQRGRRRRRVVVAVLAVLAVSAPAGLVGAAVFGQQARRAEDLALARSLAYEAEFLRDREPGLAKQLSLLSHGLDRDAGRRAVLDSQGTPGFLGDDKAATDLVHDAEGRVLAIPTGDGITLRGRDGSGRIDRLMTGAVAVSRDGAQLVAADFDDARAERGQLRFWDVTDPTSPRPTAEAPMPAAVSALAFAPDGNTLYAGTVAGSVLIWDLARRDAPRALPPLDAGATRVDSLAAAPRGGLLAGAGVDGGVRLWDTTDPARPTPVTTIEGEPHEEFDGTIREPLHRVAFDRTGQLLATTSVHRETGNPNVWRLDDPRAPRRIPYADETRDTSSPGPCGSGGVTSLAFSPRDEHLVVVCGGHWHVLAHQAEPAPGALVEGASSERVVTDSGPVVFDPAGPRLLQATGAGVLVWDLSDPHRPGVKGFVPMTPGTGGRLAYRASGDRHLLAMQNVGANSLWDVADVTAPKALSTGPAPNMFTGASIALSRNGGLLAAPELYDEGRLVGIGLRATDSLGGAPLALIEDLDNGIGELVFSPTAPLLAVSDNNGLASGNRTAPSVRLFDIADPAHPRQVAKLPLEAWELEFSPDGTSLTTLLHGETAGFPFDPEAGKQLRALDLSDPARPTELWRKPLPPGVGAEFAHSPDGSLFVAFDNSQTLRLWPVVDRRPVGDPVRVRVGDGAGSSRLAFSPDGRRLALIGGYREGTDLLTRPEIWDVSDRTAPSRQFHLPGGGVADFYDLAFSPDGTTLAVVRAGAGVDLWDTDPEHVVAGLCNAVGDPISRDEWERYLPGREYRPPCR